MAYIINLFTDNYLNLEKSMDNPNLSLTGRTWARLRRVIQILFLALFVWLFLKAEFGGQENLAWPVDLFFRFDPLILAAQLLTFSPLVAGLFWSLVMVALTFILGRFFCGWVCPLGTTLDGARRLLFTPRPDRGVAARWRRGKYYLLVGLLVGALFSLNLVGLFDPLSLLYRTLAIVFYPAFGYGVEKAGLTLYRLGPPLTYVSEPLYQFFKATLLPFRPLVYLLPFLTLMLFALVVAAERVDRRFWCRAFCPLGALYGLMARFSLLRRRPAALCPDCGDCTEMCKMAAFAPGKPARHSDLRMPALPPLPGGLPERGPGELYLDLQGAPGPPGPGEAPGDHRRGGGGRGRAPDPPGLPGPAARRISHPAPRGPERGGVSLPLHPLRPVHEGLPDQRPAAGAVGSGPGRALHLPAHPADGILLLLLQPVRPGVPHRRHPPPRTEGQTGHRPGDRHHQPHPLHSLTPKAPIAWCAKNIAPSPPRPSPSPSRRSSTSRGNGSRSSCRW